MEKLMLNDKTEIIIRPGASISNIIVEVADFTALGIVAAAVTASGNLDTVKFQTEGIVTGEYTNMKLEVPLFRNVDLQNGKVMATFSIRQKTEMELAIEELRSGQTLQDGAIADLGETVSGLIEGGEV